MFPFDRVARPGNVLRAAIGANAACAVLRALEQSPNERPSSEGAFTPKSRCGANEARRRGGG